MTLTYPDTFPTMRSAIDIQEIYFALAPGVPKFQNAVRQYAYDHHYLGGVGGPPVRPPLRVQALVLRGDQLHPVDRGRQRLWRLKRKMPVVEINGKAFG